MRFYDVDPSRARHPAGLTRGSIFLRMKMDCRVKPGNDAGMNVGGTCSKPAPYIAVTGNNAGGWVEDHCSVCCAQAISDPCLRQDVPRTFRICLDLLPELSDINTKILWVREVIPQFPQQKSVRQHLAGMLNEHAQELVFLRRQLDLLVADLDDAPYQIDREIADTKNRTFSLNVKLMPKCGAHPGKEFIHAERLRHIVVGSEIESNQVRLLRQQLQGRLAVGSLQNFIALRCQPHAQELADRALVIDHKDLGRSGTHAAVSRRWDCGGTGSLIVNTAPVRS